MPEENVEKMSDAIQRSRALRAESQRRREVSHKLMEEAEQLVIVSKSPRRTENQPHGDSKTDANITLRKRQKE